MDYLIHLRNALITWLGSDVGTGGLVDKDGDGPPNGYP